MIKNKKIAYSFLEKKKLTNFSANNVLQRGETLIFVTKA